ncbi:MAG: hypothetical protein RL336_1030, partial [Pseudomonadota bacterium]
MRLITLLVAFGLTLAAQASENPVAIVIHGGAGTILKKNITPAQREDYHHALQAAVKRGHQ